MFELCMPSAVHVLHDTRLSFMITEQCSFEDVLERVVVSDIGEGVLFPTLPLNLLGSQVISNSSQQTFVEHALYVRHRAQH